MQHTALEKHYIKSTAILSHIDFQYIADLIIDLHSGCIRQFNRIPLIVLGNIEHSNIGTQYSQRHSFFTAGATDVSYPDARICIEVVGIPL